MAYYRPVKQTIDGTISVNITALRKSGYLQTNTQVSGAINYTSNTTNITTRVEVQSESDEYLTLKYEWKGEEVTQRIGIVKRPSNLKRGSLYFFVCPYTSKYVRNLYLPEGVTQFASNYAFIPPIYYPSQTHSKQYKPVGQCFHIEDLLNELTNTRTQTHYKGKETKRYKRIKELINKYNDASERSLYDLINFCKP